MTTESVPVWPRIEAVTRSDGTGELTIDGTSHPIQAPTIEEARQTILTRIADTAAELRRPVRALASGPDGQWPLMVHPDGRVEDDDSRPAWAIGPIAPSPSAPAPETASKTASKDEAATPEPPVTGAADPAVEKPDSGPWARAARQAQARATSTQPGLATGPAPVDLPTLLGLPEEDTVVRVHREAIDTTPAPAQSAAPGRRRIVPLTLAVAGAVVLVAAGTVAVIALTGNGPGPGPTDSAVARPGAGANLPVQAPAGYGQTAVWSVPVGSEPQVLITPDGGVLAAPVGDETITVFDAAEGTAIWEGRDPVEGLHLSRVGDRPVLAADSPGTLHVWPLDTTDPAGVAPTTIELGSDQAEVTYDGTAPLIVLPDQAVALLEEKSATPVRRDVPVGATPVAATPEHVIAVGPGSWWTITADADPVRHDLPEPKQAVGDPTAAIVVGGNQLAVVWHTADSAEDVLALVGLDRNVIRATSLIRSSAIPPDAEPLRDRAGSTRTIGPVLVDVGPKPVLADLGDITPEAVIGRTVYGTSKSKPAVATWSPDGVDLEASESTGETAPIAALTEDVAFVVASEGDETLLYALPRIGETRPKGRNP
ncbi:hypothetical protein ACFT2C_10245 [Promicromonospora sp. NPDC057138]|uniref:hypothetical protein n=1 Tax=Promicromonospora sp. NPDC057138 TaxID=3346031 RepID=UPI00363420CE